MAQKFKLKPGEMKSIETAGKTYQISCDLFTNHDHKKKPIYYYHDKMKDEDFVATVEGNDCPPYDSPYSNTVDAYWSVFREKTVIHFAKKQGHLEVEIEEK